jgi:hypothetical protein
MEPDDSDHPSPTNMSWGQRHGLTIMLVVMALMMAVVIVVQMTT